MTAVANRLDPPVEQPRWLALAAPALILVTLVAQFLASHSYNLLLPESLILLAGAAAAGLGVGCMARLRPGTLEPLLIGFLLITFFIKRPELSDPLWSVARTVGTVVGEFASAIGLLVVLMVGVFLSCWVLRRHLSAIVVLGFGAMLLATILLPEGAGGRPVRTGALPNDASDLPPIMYIILDEHIGLAGLPRSVPKSTEAASVLRSTYRDFVIHSHAYSRHALTQYALSSLMNGTLGVDFSDVLARPVDTHQYRLMRNALFTKLRERGYAISVYQSTWLDFCRGADTCYSYGASLSNIQQTRLTTVQRSKVILNTLFSAGYYPTMTPLAAMEALDSFMKDVEQRPRGTAYFLHLILPHAGFFYKDDCSVADPDEWSGHGIRYSATRTARYDLYLSQLTCVSNRMSQLFKVLKQLGTYDGATVIVSGDHGSRIAERPWHRVAADSLSQRDVIDHYSTLLVVKTPDTVAGVNTEPLAIQDYFAEQYLDMELRSELANTVFVRDSNGEFNTREIRWPDP